MASGAPSMEEIQMQQQQVHKFTSRYRLLGCKPHALSIWLSQKAQYEEKRASILDQILEPAAKERYYWMRWSKVCIWYLFSKLAASFTQQTVALKHREEGQGPRRWRHSYYSGHLGQAAWSRKSYISFALQVDNEHHL